MEPTKIGESNAYRIYPKYTAYTSAIMLYEKVIGHISQLHKSKKDGKDQESIQSSTTPDSGYHVGKWQNVINITKKSQEVSPFPAGDHKAAMNRRESMT